MKRLNSLVVLAAVALGGCGGDGPAKASRTPTPTATATASEGRRIDSQKRYAARYGFVTLP